MAGKDYKPKPPFVRGDQIVIHLDWWESCDAERPALTEEQQEYLNSIIVGQAICPRMAMLDNTERAREILGLEPPCKP